MTLRDQILAAQKDGEAMLVLINRFRPLLRKSAAKLKTEDAYEDFVADFIEIVRGIRVEAMRIADDGAFVNYISRAIRRACAKRRQRKFDAPPETTFSDLSEADSKDAEAANSAYDKYFPDQIHMPNLLAEQEGRVLYMKFVKQMTVTEIATKLNISRQAVNQAKNRGLDKLRQYNNAAA